MHRMSFMARSLLVINNSWITLLFSGSSQFSSAHKPVQEFNTASDVFVHAPSPQYPLPSLVSLPSDPPNTDKLFQLLPLSLTLGGRLEAIKGCDIMMDEKAAISQLCSRQLEWLNSSVSSLNSFFLFFLEESSLI